MTGAVVVLPEPDAFAVACFRTDCPEHGDGCHVPPWVDDFTTKSAAEKCAREHRAMVRDYWESDACPTCRQRVPTVNPTPHAGLSGDAP